MSQTRSTSHVKDCSIVKDTESDPSKLKAFKTEMCMPIDKNKREVKVMIASAPVQQRLTFKASYAANAMDGLKTSWKRCQNHNSDEALLEQLSLENQDRWLMLRKQEERNEAWEVLCVFDMHRLINNNGGSLDLKCAIEHASFEQVISQLYSIASIDPNVWERTYVLPAIVLYAVLGGGIRTFHTKEQQIYYYRRGRRS